MSLHDRLVWKKGELEIVHSGEGAVLLDFTQDDFKPRNTNSVTIEQRVAAIEANKPHLSITNDRVLLVKKESK
jgi:hypothetical protein